MKLALIAGTGTGDLFQLGTWEEIQTPYGSACITHANIVGREIIVLRRHGLGMDRPPHLVNYHANLWALKEVGVSKIIATAAVGSLRLDIGPGSLALLEDFIDFMKGSPITRYDKPGLIAHVDFSMPYCSELMSFLRQAALCLGLGNLPGVTYVGMSGPRYETPAEVRMLGKLGGDVVGMTAVPETILAREFGMCYSCLAIVTNYGAGLSDVILSHEDVVKMVKARSAEIRSLLERAIMMIPDDSKCSCPTLAKPFE
ncbi:MAG: MTAP family purine nucleoside phosphorylase [Armatimonadota bacterium]|nr:MTAP family purine nucleoside phosphorylase [Armatimonadota bacterium]